MNLKLFMSLGLVLAPMICQPTYGSDNWKLPFDDTTDVAEPPNFSHQDQIGCFPETPNTPQNRQMILERNLYACFDPACLSNKQARICSQVTILSEIGMPEYKISTTSKADAADIFYCEQAIWEALPLGKRVTADIDGTIEFKSNIGNEPEHAKWTELHSADRSVVKLHFVPASVKRRTIVAFDVSAAENVVVMRVSDVKNPKLQAFRQEWFTFLDSHGRLDGEDLDQQKRLMRKKYESLFLHP